MYTYIARHTLMHFSPVCLSDFEASAQAFFNRMASKGLCISCNALAMPSVPSPVTRGKLLPRLPPALRATNYYAGNPFKELHPPSSMERNSAFGLDFVAVLLQLCSSPYCSSRDREFFHFKGETANLFSHHFVLVVVLTQRRKRFCSL